MVQVALSILKPAGSAGVTVQLAIEPPELLKVMSVMTESISGAIASCTVAPTLPAGLSIDSTTCTISGTPTEVRVLTLYTVTAKNAADDTDSTTFSLTVNATAPTLANAVATNQIAFIDFTITDITFNNSGGAIASWPLMVQVAPSKRKPAGSAGVTVQLAIAPPELLKVMSVMTESIITIWSAPVAFARLRIHSHCKRCHR
jgi:hypothetical protein